MIAIEITRQFSDEAADDADLESLVRAICQKFGVSDATITVGIVDDERISELNRQFLDHEGTTDSLSFDLSDGDDPDDPRVFDLIVNGQLAAREAAERGHTPRAELALYVTHGLLHQLGFDDATPEQAQKMHQAEDEILQHMGFGVVYNSRLRSR